MDGLDFTEKATILVVDDTPENLTLMSNLLRGRYLVKVANSGEKALQIAASDSPPDLILLDIMMPGMDGYEVCERLKHDPKTTNIPVIFLTAKGEMMDEKDGLEIGAVDYITKPISPPIVLARVKNHLALKASADFLRDQNHFLELEVNKRTGELLASREIAQRNQQLEEAGRMKSEFLANMSHELRTPLNAIIGFSEMLGDGMLGELTSKQKEAVNDIFTSGNHLLALINDILDLSKVEAGKMTLELDALQPALLVQAGLQVVREQAMAHRLRLVTEVADDLGRLWLDERKLKQILYNLLSNAVKFTPEDGEVRVSARRVARRPLPDASFADVLELAVSDTGIGISVADQAHLFEPFTQIDSTLARRYEGTGLGLAMVKRLAELHGGGVTLDSMPDRGSTFTVWLPWHAADVPDAELAAQQAATSGPHHPLPLAAITAGPNGTPPLAMVIEDDAKAAELLRLQLQRNGFRVVLAASGESALELAARECPALVTVDIRLPGMDGWTFIERFKQDPLFAKVPVVVVSIVADRIRGLTLGASYVLQKPVGREELARALTASGFPAMIDGERRSVLVIDDDPTEIKMLGTYLHSTGYRVLTACSWQDGIDLARSKRPDLIVLDLMMPEVSGFEVVEVLKRDPETAGIPIVVVTAKEMTDAERTRLDGDVMKVIDKAGLNQGRFIGEVRQAISGTGA